MNTKLAKTKHKDDRNDLRHPQRARNKARSISKNITQIEPTPEQIDTFEQLALIGDDNGDFVGVDFSPALPRANLVVLLSELVEGKGWQTCMDAAHLSWSQVMLCRKVDPDGFGRYLEAAQTVKEDVQRLQSDDELYRRAVEGYDRPLIGRVAKDEDGIVAHERRYSDRLLEFLKTKRDKRYADTGTGGGGGTGAPSVLINLTIPAHLQTESQAPAPVSVHDLGGNEAEINLEALDL